MNLETNFEDKINPFPGYTIWERRKYCCLSMVYIPKLKAHFWKEWEFQPLIPFIVLGLLITNFIIYLFFSFEYLEKWNILIIPCFLFFGILFSYSYIRVITDGPGYFPFYWSLGENIPQDLRHSHVPLLGTVSPSGYISTFEQDDWARSHPKPGRSIVSGSAHRIVLRPDHFCGWTTVWIGKRNFKFFVLFNFYGMFYLLTSIIAGGIGAYKQYQISLSFSALIQALFVVLSLMFFLLTVSFVFSGILSAITNTTTWEKYNKIKSYDMGLRKNLEDAFGPGSCFKWFIPFSPWTNYTNEELASQYDSYEIHGKINIIRNDQFDFNQNNNNINNERNNYDEPKEGFSLDQSIHRREVSNITDMIVKSEESIEFFSNNQLPIQSNIESNHIDKLNMNLIENINDKDDSNMEEIQY